jgi:hypothetical protein
MVDLINAGLLEEAMAVHATVWTTGERQSTLLGSSNESMTTYVDGLPRASSARPTGTPPVGITASNFHKAAAKPEQFPEKFAAKPFLDRTPRAKNTM